MIYPILSFLTSQIWVVEGPTFDLLVSIVQRHADGEKLNTEAIAAATGRDPAAIDAREPVMEIDGDTAIIPVRGMISRYADSVNGICQARGRSAESVQTDLRSSGQDRRQSHHCTPGQSWRPSCRDCRNRRPDP